MTQAVTWVSSRRSSAAAASSGCSMAAHRAPASPARCAACSWSPSGARMTSSGRARAAGPGRRQLLARRLERGGQPSYAVPPHPEQPPGHRRGRDIADQRADHLHRAGEGQHGVLLRGAQRAGGGDRRRRGQPRPAHRARPVDHDRERRGRLRPLHRGQVLDCHRPGLAAGGGHALYRGVDVQVAVDRPADRPQPRDPAHRRPPGPGSLQHDAGAEPNRGGAQVLVGRGGHGGQQLERSRVVGQGLAHRPLV
jgi:hypothetical protein